MTRIVLSIVRRPAEPMTTRDLALELLVTRPPDNKHIKLLRPLTKRVGVSLRTQRTKGTVRSELGPGHLVL